jgi:Holliday junction resolvasome RuvABC endonuclease subunit
VADHEYQGTSESRCATCGEFWEHPNHKKQHKRGTGPSIYVGIDPGSKNCALVAWSPTRGLITTWKPKGPMPTGVLRLQRLMIDINYEFHKMSKGGKIKKIAMESYSMAEKYGQHASGEVGAAIKLCILGFFFPEGVHDDPRAFPVLVAPQQLKKFATGSGNTKKEMISKEVLKRWGMDFNDTNIAEAYALARIAHAVDTGPEMPKFQEDVVKALEGRTEFSPVFAPPPRKLIRVGGRGST